MTSYRESAFKIYEHEQILKHHYRRLYGVRPTIKTSHFSSLKQRIGGSTKRQKRKRERRLYLRHQKMLKNLQEAERQALGKPLSKTDAREPLGKWAVPAALGSVQETPQHMDNDRQHSSSAPARSPPQEHQYQQEEGEFGFPPSTVSPRLYGKHSNNMTGNAFGKKQHRRGRRGQGRGRGRGRKRGGRKRGGDYQRRRAKSSRPAPIPKLYASSGSPHQNYTFGLSPRRPTWNDSTAMGLGGRDPSLRELLPDVPHEWLESILSPRAVQKFQEGQKEYGTRSGKKRRNRKHKKKSNQEKMLSKPRIAPSAGIGAMLAMHLAKKGKL